MFGWKKTDFKSMLVHRVNAIYQGKSQCGATIERIEAVGVVHNNVDTLYSWDYLFRF